MAKGRCFPVGCMEAKLSTNFPRLYRFANTKMALKATGKPSAKRWDRTSVRICQTKTFFLKIAPIISQAKPNDGSPLQSLQVRVSNPSGLGAHAGEDESTIKMAKNYFESGLRDYIGKIHTPSVWYNLLTPLGLGLDVALGTVLAQMLRFVTEHVEARITQ
ncbi:hypothetical protein N7532_005570 [Penicillium argentinense]|uniref:Uncharacterized protein n=1 Tax=Penicillium argentinense TaxID=1131581 RepID=A0A9W9FEG6_9EURO|nr:uncharacterized protein N7532_005570 [Penicillium argentinense]KAJ5098569.1 hypothetical protein N7532_005570 [Penicillium argentinense]